MNLYPGIGERFYYDKKRFICVKATDGCHGCDLLMYFLTPADLCFLMRCKAYERLDRTSVILRLQPKYRKEGME